MSFDINKAAQPYHYYMKFLKQNCRPDNRKLHETRAFDIEIGCINTANGSSLVKWGLTNVLCGVKAQLCKPKLTRPNKGFIIPNVDLPPLCSSKFKVGPASELATQLTQLMYDVICESKFISEDDLCVKPGKLVWSLHIDIVCLNYDGNLADSCCLAMICALKNTRLYEIIYDTELDKPVFKMPFNFLPLNIKNLPICTTLFEIEDEILLCDPNKEEEEFSNTHVVICTLDENKICLTRKYGGFSIIDKQIDLCIDKAISNANFIRKIIEKKFL